jgi:hypothetical protein
VFAENGLEQWFPQFPDPRLDQSRARDFVFRALVNWCLFCARLMPPPQPDAPAAEEAPDGADFDEDADVDADFTSLWKPVGKRSVGPTPPPPPKFKPSAKQFLQQHYTEKHAERVGADPAVGRFRTELPRIKAEVGDFLKHGWAASDEDQTLQELDADPLEWWRRRGRMLYPTVALVVLRVIAVSGTSVQDERTASAGRRAMDKRSINLKPGKGEKLICARSELICARQGTEGSSS